MIEISAQVFWSGILLLIGVQIFSLVFERMMMYRVVRDLQSDIRQLSMNFSTMSAALQRMVVFGYHERGREATAGMEEYFGPAAATTEKEFPGLKT